MEFEFSKMHGIGNDYVYINCYKETIDKPENLAEVVSDRHFGIGSDGLVLIQPSEVADCKMCMYNADGTVGAMCGNGIRCVGKYVYDRGLVSKDVIKVETLSGTKKLKLSIHNNQVSSVTVNMGKPSLKAKDIPVKTNKSKMIGDLLIVKKRIYRITCVSMGNPHTVIFVKDVNKIKLNHIGKAIENHRIFPNRTNVEFVKVIDDTNIEVRVWERGSGETLACGTGACACVVAAVAAGYCKKSTLIKVKLLGGYLYIKYLANGDVLMNGPAAFVYTGKYKLKN